MWYTLMEEQKMQLQMVGKALVNVLDGELTKLLLMDQLDAGEGQ